MQAGLQAQSKVMPEDCSKRGNIGQEDASRKKLHHIGGRGVGGYFQCAKKKRSMPGDKNQSSRTDDACESRGQRKKQDGEGQGVRRRRGRETNGEKKVVLLHAWT